MILHVHPQNSSTVIPIKPGPFDLPSAGTYLQNECQTKRACTFNKEVDSCHWKLNDTVFQGYLACTIWGVGNRGGDNGCALLKSALIPFCLGFRSRFARKAGKSEVSVCFPSYPDSFSHAGSTGGRSYSSAVNANGKTGNCGVVAGNLQPNVFSC